MDIRFDASNGVVTVNGATISTPNASAATEMPDLLPGVNQLLVTGDPGAMLAALTMTTAHDEEKSARAQRNAAMRSQEASEAAEIQELHQKADLQRIQGIVDGVCDFAQAGMDYAQGVKTFDATSDRLQADKLDQAQDPSLKDPSLKDQSNQLHVEGAKADASASGWKSGSEAMTGAKSISHGAFEAEITNEDADSKQHEIAAQSFKQMADDAHDNEKDAKDLLNKALDFYKEYTDTKNQTALAASHRA